ncbi:G-protein subunit alpha 6 [Reticulomyxa filosa]|uniref:G-protein subunit alpha 6 n=1 Tax=Reticulomyxa filosa TaxID=46433 RepID=X6NEK6_RETFI|nr:G-protein subunit alpha 6 [Reticulomyxa filosa]|eukprot:ETO24765.1 G-protein subunit alpha 6 [Reticulomyxa filosa]
MQLLRWFSKRSSLMSEERETNATSAEQNEEKEKKKAEEVSSEIDIKFQEEKILAKSIIHVLMLGPGGHSFFDYCSKKKKKIKKTKNKTIKMNHKKGSGKTTVAKQMINMNDNEREAKEPFDSTQCLESIHKMICYDMQEKQNKQIKKQNKTFFNFVTYTVKQFTYIYIVTLCSFNAKERNKNADFEIEDERCRKWVDSIASDESIFFHQVIIRKTMAERIEKIWACRGIQNTFKRLQHQFIMDNTKYFLDQIQKLYFDGDEGSTKINPKDIRYTPSWDDYLRIREQTTEKEGGRNKKKKKGRHCIFGEKKNKSPCKKKKKSTYFYYSLIWICFWYTGVSACNISKVIQNKKWTFRLIDVGGQKSERKKWVNVFHGIDVIIYIMSLNGYDQNTFEDGSINCYNETFDVFRQIAQNSVFQATDFFVFLNKMDLFEEKIKSVPFTIYDKSFDDSSKHDKDKVLKYIETRFEAIWYKDCPETWHRKRGLFFHLTCSLDTGMMQSVIANVEKKSGKIFDIFQVQAMLILELEFDLEGCKFYNISQNRRFKYFNFLNEKRSFKTINILQNLGLTKILKHE